MVFAPIAKGAIHSRVGRMALEGSQAHIELAISGVGVQSARTSRQCQFMVWFEAYR